MAHTLHFLEESLSEELADQVKGCVFGAALGDAFGLATEFMTKDQARQYYGVGPIKFGLEETGHPFVRDAFRIGWQQNDFTDDTDQMLLLGSSLLETNGKVDPRHFAYRLHEWAHNGFPELDKPSCGIGFTIGSTITHDEFLTNPHRAAYKVWNLGNRESASNGAVMRTSALGISYYYDEGRVVENAICAAKVTHADPRSITATVIVSVIVSRLLRRAAGTKIGEPAPINRQKILELLMKGCSSVETSTVHLNVNPKPKCLENLSTQSKQASAKLMANFKRFMSESGVKEEWGTFQLANPVHEYSGSNPGDSDPRHTNPVPITTKQKDSMHGGMDTFGPDPEMCRICSEVVNDYKFMLTDNELCPPGSDWVQQLELYTSVKSLGELQSVCPDHDIGYSFKCLGYGIYCATRAIPDVMPGSDYFKAIMTELTLEGGDADTNGAVAGAILGCRLGLRDLPSEWADGLRHSEYLHQVIERMMHFV